MTVGTMRWLAASWLLLAYTATAAAQAQDHRFRVAGQAGYTYGLDDSPPYGFLRGGSFSARAEKRWWVGLEFIDIDLFGPYESYDQKAWMLTPVVEYNFQESGRFQPYVAFGVGLTQFRSYLEEDLIRDPDDPDNPDKFVFTYGWDREHFINVAGGFGVRLYLTSRLYVAPEARLGLSPPVRVSVALGYSF